MKKIKENMLLQIIMGAIILIALIIILAQFTDKSSQEDKNEDKNRKTQIDENTKYVNSRTGADKAIVTLTYGDTCWDIFDNDEQFTLKAIINANTKITSKSNLSNSIDTIENSKNDMIMINLDSTTIYDENPVITVYASSDN